MLPDDDITGLQLKIVVKSASPRIFREDLALVPRQLIWGRVFPTVVLAWLRSAVGYKEDAETDFPGGAHDGAQVLQEADLFGDRLGAGEELPSLTEKVVIGIDQQHCGRFRIIDQSGHRTLLQEVRMKDARAPRGSRYQDADQYVAGQDNGE